MVAKYEYDKADIREACFQLRLIGFNVRFKQRGEKQYLTIKSADGDDYYGPYGWRARVENLLRNQGFNAFRSTSGSTREMTLRLNPDKKI
jgi:hypothetical protein